MSRLDTIANRLATIQLYREENGSGDGWSITDDAAYLLGRVRELEAGLRGVLMENGHSAGCLAGNRGSLPCEPFCQAARAALDGEG